MHIALTFLLIFLIKISEKGSRYIILIVPEKMSLFVESNFLELKGIEGEFGSIAVKFSSLAPSERPLEERLCTASIPDAERLDRDSERQLIMEQRKNCH